MHEIPKPRDNTQKFSGGVSSKSNLPYGRDCSWAIKQQDSSCLKKLANDTRIVIGNTGDHALILQLLVQSLQKSILEDFHSRLDEPSYEPSDRLLLKQKNNLIGHVQVSKQIAWFEEERIPVSFFQDFVTLPEYQTDQSRTSLLSMAETIAHEEGSALALISTENPSWFASQGWSCWRGQGYTRANVRSVLTHVDAPHLGRRQKSVPLEVRTWRHFELDSIKCLYEQVSIKQWGSIFRSDSNWQWLVGRKAHDQILIAVEKNHKKSKVSEKIDENDLSSSPNVVGYAVIRDSCIVEMISLPGYSKVRPMLVAQACRDAIDRDHHFISLHTAADDSMHELLVTAGGSWIEGTATPNETLMFKLLTPDKWVEKFYPVFHQRSRKSEIDRPFEIDFSLEERKYRLTLTRRSSRVELTKSLGKKCVECDWHTFQDLMTCNLSLTEAIESRRMRSIDQHSQETLEAIFPAKLFWQSPFPALQP